MQSPDCQHVRRVSTPNIYDILFKQELFGIASIASKKTKVARPTWILFECQMKTPHIIAGVATGRCHEANSRPARLRQREHVAIQSWIPRLHGEATPSHRHNLLRFTRSFDNHHRLQLRDLNRQVDHTIQIARRVPHGLGALIGAPRLERTTTLLHRRDRYLAAAQRAFLAMVKERDVTSRHHIRVKTVQGR
jgi:hypothetical protein